MQITVKRKCKWVLKYIWVYFTLRDGIVDLCYVILVILWIIIIKGRCLLDICDIYDLDSLNNTPTSISSQRSSCLDVILTNVPGYFRESGILEIGLSNHCLVYTVLNKKLRT